MSQAARGTSFGRIGFARGILLSVGILVGMRVLPQLAVSAGLPKNAITVEEAFAVFAFHLLIWSLVWLVIARSSRASFANLFLLRSVPSSGQVRRWALVGLPFGVPAFLGWMDHSHRLHEPDFLIFLVPVVLTYVLMWPLIEEPVFRGLIFSVLIRWNRFGAYIISTLVFTLHHTQSYPDLILHGTIGLTNLHIMFLLSFGLLSAYIYESTGKLSLCLICHGAANGFGFLGLPVGYLLDH
jgi:membrane protease YdiL (CAAX protease family)